MPGLRFGAALGCQVMHSKSQAYRGWEMQDTWKHIFRSSQPLLSPICDRHVGILSRWWIRSSLVQLLMCPYPSSNLLAIPDTDNVGVIPY